MAHFAKIENNVVTNVIVVENRDCGNCDFPESEHIGLEFLKSIGLDGNYIQTSYNGNFRNKFAGIGDTYDTERNAFISPQPHPKWQLDDETLMWMPPIPKPDDGKSYIWNEYYGKWTEINPKDPII